jgi:hypothetical protein
MNHAYVSPPRRQVGRPAAGDPPRWRRRTVLAVSLLVLLGGGAAAWRLRPDPHLAAAKGLRQELFSEAGRQLPPQERRQKFEQLRAEVGALSPEQRRGLRSEGMSQRREEMHRYFKMSPDEKTRFLDELIARQEKRRQEWQAAGGAPFVGPGGNRPGGPNGGGTAQDRDKRRQDFLDSAPAAGRNEMTAFRNDLNARRQQLGLQPAGRR